MRVRKATGQRSGHAVQTLLAVAALLGILGLLAYRAGLLHGASDRSYRATFSRLGDSARGTLGRLLPRETQLLSVGKAHGQADSMAGRLAARGLAESSTAVRTITATADRPAPRRGGTLVLYVYNAVDEEQQQNFLFFVRWGIRTDDGVTYRIILATGEGVLVSSGATSGT